MTRRKDKPEPVKREMTAQEKAYWRQRAIKSAEQFIAKQEAGEFRSQKRHGPEPSPGKTA